MKEQIISFETAKLAKEKGFDITNRNSYDENTGVMLPKDPYGHCYALEGTCPAATQSLLQKWLREVHNIDITIITNYKDKQPIKTKTYRVGIIYIENNLIECFFIRPLDTEFSFIEFDTYELALEAGLIESLKLVKDESTNN